MSDTDFRNRNSFWIVLLPTFLEEEVFYQRTKVLLHIVVVINKVIYRKIKSPNVFSESAPCWDIVKNK